MGSEVMPCFLWHSRLLAPATRWDSYSLWLICKLETYNQVYCLCFLCHTLFFISLLDQSSLGLAYS